MIKQLLLLLIMLKSNIFSKTLGIVFLALTAGLLWEVASLVLSAPDNNNAYYIPSDARWTARMDGSAFFKESFSEAFVTSEETEIVDLIQELVENRTTSRESVDLGIDFLSDIYVSSVKREGKRLLVFSFNLRDAKKFNNLLSVTKSGQIALSADKKVGILVVSALKNDAFSPAKLAQFAQEFISPQKKYSAAQERENVLSSFWINTKEYQGELHVSAENNKLSFEGNLHVDIQKKHPFKQLKPNGLHLSHASITGALKDSLAGVLKGFMPSLPSGITSVSMNYRGSEITSDGNMLFLPEMDILLGYETEVDIRHFLEIHLESQTISNLTESSFKCVGKTFYYRQIDDRTIYIGREKPTFSDTAHFLLITGEPSSILTLHGDDSYLRFARLMPTFLATENLITSMETIHLSISEPNNGMSQIEGTIDFTSEVTPIGAILEFLVRTELVK